jgi:hypothetical protein
VAPIRKSSGIFVCEDLFIQKLVGEVLARRGYRVQAVSTTQAVEILHSHPDAIDVLITNDPFWFLPFADRLPLVYLSSNPDTDLAAEFGHCATIQKPFVNEELLRTVESLLSVAAA